MLFAQTRWSARRLLAAWAFRGHSNLPYTTHREIANGQIQASNGGRTSRTAKQSGFSAGCEDRKNSSRSVEALNASTFQILNAACS